MAGLGRKTFASGEVLTAANTQGYLMDQSVMVFADAAARTSAIAAPAEGMHSYLSDTDSTEVYDGSAWGALRVKVLQVVRATDSTTRSTTSTSQVDASISVTITPTSATNAILLIWNYGPTPTNYQIHTITDSSNTALSGAEYVSSGTAAAGFNVRQTAIGYVIAGSTSAITFKGRFAATSGTAYIVNTPGTGQLYAIEVTV